MTLLENLKTLTDLLNQSIENSAHVLGNVNSEHLKVEGKITGDITADLLEVGSSGIIDGKLKTNSLSVDTGAQISGNVGKIS